MNNLAVMTDPDLEEMRVGEVVRLQALVERLRDVLESAEGFMSGFEDDETQEGVVETLQEMREAITAAQQASDPDAVARDLTASELVASMARLMKDGEHDAEGNEFVMENDDAVDTLHGLIDRAREIAQPKTSAPSIMAKAGGMSL